MSSYIVIRIPEPISVKDVEKVVNEKSIFESDKGFKEGVYPSSYFVHNNAVCFEYGFEFEAKRPTLDGDIPDKWVQKSIIVFVDRVLFVGYRTKYSKDTESKALGFIESNLIKGYILEPIHFESATLSSVIEKCPDVAHVGMTPKGEKKPDRLTASARKVTETQFWEEYGSEPLDTVKVNISGVTEEARVGFNKKGVITIYNKSFSLQEQLLVLKYIAEKIIGPYLRTKGGFQKKLFW